MLGFVILLALQSYQRAREGRSSELVQSWIGELDREFAIADPKGARQEAAYAQWLDEETQRREGRRERIGEATPFVPVQLWFVLGIGASLMIAYMCAQADRREGVLIQSIPIGFVTAVVTAGLLVVLFLDYLTNMSIIGISPRKVAPKVPVQHRVRGSALVVRYFLCHVRMRQRR